MKEKTKLSNSVAYWLIDSFFASALIRFALESAMDLQFTAILQEKFSESWILANSLEFIKLYGALSFLLLYAIFAAFIFFKIV